MNFFGIGPFELLLILIIATVVLGPERMAEAGRMLGRLYGQYRSRWQKDVDELTQELRRELAVLQQELDDIRQTAEGEFKTAQNALEDVMDTKIDLDAVYAESEATKKEMPKKETQAVQDAPESVVDTASDSNVALAADDTAEKDEVEA